MAPVDWIQFPPLAALRAFEATGRLGGFSAAARALNVTHAAVAQQVRGLERFLGVSLLHRDGRAMALSPEGATLTKALSDGFGGIAEVLETLKSGNDRPVTLTLTPTFASNWLMPRLGKFWAAHPDIQISLRPDPNVLDLRAERLDFGIRYGLGNWPGVESRFLTSAHDVIVGAPSLFSNQAALSNADMAELPWVLEAGWPEARSWIACCTELDPEKLRITEFATEELALSAARQGYGLHVTSAALVEHDLISGTLRVVFESEDEGLGYYIVTPPGPLRSAARTVIRWLLQSA